ncbi:MULTISPECIES: guanosine monophosphate reductase [Haloferax]|uniref:GMP reductase n=2 Tax=Haloferax TaxID=2251 RepID=A0A6G1Z717_9EURY|nr:MULTISPECIES: guanosine monophosphate reductase [Haloferax]KAB1185032.1 guanosine monophosphate reductase [Haloferax sp. CBA1149]MRW82208.1 guanosine monophosphate reductase [Haloferax marinisediminis]
MEIRTGLSYGDVLLIPQRSPVDSRSDVELSTNVTPSLQLEAPLVSAAMDTVTETELATTLSDCGGLGVVHRFLDIDEQAAQVRQVAENGGTVAGAVGINEAYLERTAALLDAGADAIVMDIAHGHMERCLDAVAHIRDEFDPEIVAGNVVTPAAVEDLWEAGAGCVKVGVGPGSHCTTREVAGAGFPQLTAVSNCAERAHDLGIHVMADGGIRTSGDAAKALMAGADTVMMGSFFAGTDEAPGHVVEVGGDAYKRSRGMASTEAASDRDDKQSDVVTGEGVEALTPYKGPVEPLVEEFLAGIRSGVSYCGGHTIAAARENASFVRVAASAKEREGAHGVVFTEESAGETADERERDVHAPLAD